MLDYKLLQALAAVIENGGFERAGEILGLTQSAVSQRIKSLEVRLGQPVLVRHPELQATPAGNKLLNHFQQVQLLERDLRKTIPALAEDTTRLRIAINADSLATWWAAVVGEFCSREGLLLDLVIEDQDVGLKRMRDGDVAACLCSSSQPIAGGRCVALGEMTYMPLATPQYVRQFFPMASHQKLSPPLRLLYLAPTTSYSTDSWPAVATTAVSPTICAPPPKVSSSLPGPAWATA